MELGTVVGSVIQRWFGYLEVTTCRLVCDAWPVGAGTGFSFRMRPTVVCPKCNPALARAWAILALPSRGIDNERLTFKFQGLDQRLTGVERARPVKAIVA